MYICLECGKPFENLCVVHEDGHAQNVSPCCCEAWTEANRCKQCGEPICSGDLCKNCRKDAMSRFKNYLEKFSKLELEYLSDCIEGMDLCNPLKVS